MTDNPKLKKLLEDGAAHGSGHAERVLIENQLPPEERALWHQTCAFVKAEDMLPAAQVAAFARTLGLGAKMPSGAPSDFAVDDTKARPPGKLLSLDAYDCTEFTSTHGAPIAIEKIITMRAGSNSVKALLRTADGVFCGNIIRKHSPGAQAQIAAAKAAPVPLNATPAKPGYYSTELNEMIYKGTGGSGWNGADRAEVLRLLRCDATSAQVQEAERLFRTVKDTETLFPSKVRSFAQAIGKGNAVYTLEEDLKRIREARTAEAARASLDARTQPATAAPVIASVESFPEIVLKLVTSGATEADAVIAAAAQKPAEHRAWLASGGGRLIKSSRAAVSKVQAAQPTFPERVAAFRAGGRSKGDSVTMAIAAFPDQHRAWLQSGGSQL